MIEDLSKIYDLLYHHVIVSTNVNRTKDCSINFNRTSEESGKVLEFTGYLKVVDPISKSVILCQIENEIIFNNALILGHVISSIQISTMLDAIPTSIVSKIIQEDSLIKFEAHSYFEGSNHQSVSSEVINRREEEIIEWLRKKRIPAQHDCVDNSIIVADSVRLKPPYDSPCDYTNCKNMVVLKRLKNIVDSRPQQSSNAGNAKANKQEI